MANTNLSRVKRKQNGKRGKARVRTDDSEATRVNDLYRLRSWVDIGPGALSHDDLHMQPRQSRMESPPDEVQPDFHRLRRHGKSAVQPRFHSYKAYRLKC